MRETDCAATAWLQLRDHSRRSSDRPTQPARPAQWSPAQAAPRRLPTAAPPRLGLRGQESWLQGGCRPASLGSFVMDACCFTGSGGRICGASRRPMALLSPLLCSRPRACPGYPSGGPQHGTRGCQAQDWGALHVVVAWCRRGEACTSGFPPHSRFRSPAGVCRNGPWSFAFQIILLGSRVQVPLRL